MTLIRLVLVVVYPIFQARPDVRRFPPEGLLCETIQYPLAIFIFCLNDLRSKYKCRINKHCFIAMLNEIVEKRERESDGESEMEVQETRTEK